MAAGYGLRGVVDSSAPIGAAGPSASAVGLVAAATGAPGPSGAPADAGPPRPRHAFRSRPDLVPPALLVGTPASGTAPGLVFTTPNNGDGPDGPTIYDETGEPVWVRAGAGRQATDFQVIDWGGAPALAWWEGKATIGVGDGEYVIADAGYGEVARVAAGGHADLHELHLTPSGTALYLAYEVVPMPPVSAPASGGSPAPTTQYDCVVIEVDAVTGARVWEWHSADHIEPDETEVPYPEDPATPWDPFHANSVHLDDDGNVLVSARNTSCVYKVDHATGDILWRLGGKYGDLELLDGLTVALQHDARRQPDGTITIFDNGRPPAAARGLVVEVDETERTARVVRVFERPDGLQAASQGSLQALPNGDVLIGWGSQPVMTEFDPTGAVAWDASMPGAIQSYRDRRFPWTGRPTEAPALAVDALGRGSGTQRRVTAYASWNGATEVRAWRLLAGAATGALETLATVPRTGFETVLTGVTTLDPVTRVQAMAVGADGSDLGSTSFLEPCAGARGSVTLEPETRT